MAVDIPAIREVVERVCTRRDVIEACKRRDLGAVIRVLCAQGLTQGQLSSLTGIPQGRLSEYKTHKRVPTATSTFEAFADGLGMPPAARRALGLAPEAAGSGPLILPEDDQPITWAPVWGMSDPCSAIFRGQAPSRCCRRSAGSTGAISKRTS